MHRPHSRSALVALLAVTIAGAATCSPDAPGPDGGQEGDSRVAEGEHPGGTRDDVAATYPGESWPRLDPAEAGFDPVVLDGLAAEAAAEGSNCLLVARDGHLVAEWYWNGTDAATGQEVFSITKSVASTLVGIAQDEGLLDIGESASRHVPEWAGTPAEDVTVEHLLRNDSGRHWDLATDYQALVTADDRTAFAVGLDQAAPPGTTWAYNNSAIQVLDAVLKGATGDDPAAYAHQRLFAPLGMAHTEMTHDPAGNTTTFFGLRSTCQDLARFGHLFLHDGVWDGAQVVSASWVDAATGGPSQSLNAAYGYLWWINHPGPIAGPLHITSEDSPASVDGQMAPGAPQDMFWARGLGGQVVQVDPGSGTVVVRLGGGDRAAAYDHTDTARVVTDALVDPTEAESPSD